jgi:hypothetical protein
MLMDVVGVLEAWICNRGALGMAAIPLDTPEYSLIPLNVGFSGGSDHRRSAGSNFVFVVCSVVESNNSR